MRKVLILTAVLLLSSAGFVGLRLWQYHQSFPQASTEIVDLTLQKRAALTRLRDEKKFTPNVYPPLGYTGMATPQDKATANAAVNGTIDAVLAQPEGRISAKFLSDLIGKGMKSVDLLETEDRDRTQDYMIEIWYLTGFKGATRRFAYGSAFQKPEGYGEPLPPGWTSPQQPRPIGVSADERK